MKVKKAIAVIRDRVHNAHPSQDTSRLPAYVQEYLGVAINQAVGELVATGVYDIPGALLKPYTVDIKYDDERRAYYFELPVNVPALRGDAAVAGVHGVGKEAWQWIPLPQGVESVSPNFEFYGRPGWRQEGQRVYTTMLDASVKRAVAKVVAFSGELRPDDNLPVPAELHGRIFDIVAAWFIGKLELPQDATADNNDTR